MSHLVGLDHGTPRLLADYIIQGNSQGNIILFEPNTAEHTSARTIVDPVTALAPLSDSKTYAIG